MYRGTDNLSSFFAIGSQEMVADERIMNKAIAVQNAKLFNGFVAQEQEVKPAPTVSVPSTSQEENYPTKPGIIDGGPVFPSGSTSANSGVELKDAPKKFQMTTKHWVILAIVVVSAFAIYKHFSKKQ